MRPRATERWKSERWKLARDAGRAIGNTLRNDRLMQVALALAALFLAFFWLPILPGEVRRALVGWIGPAVFALLIPYAFLHGEQSMGRAVEDSFWRDLTFASWSALAAVVLRRLGAALEWDVATTLSRVGLMVCYTLIFVAIERQPHRDSVDSKRTEMRLTLPTILLLVVGLLFYFVVLPVLGPTHGSGVDLPRMDQILTALGLLLLLRVSTLAASARSARWLAVYGVLGVLALSVLLLHARQLPATIQWFGSVGVGAAMFWLPGLLSAVLLARLRHQTFPADRRGDVDLVTRLSHHPAGLAMRTMFVALAVPVVHFGAYRFHLFDPTVEEVRESWVFFWVLGLGAVALYQNRQLSAKLTSAFRERRRIENALANTERSLRLADARRKSEEAVWSKKEKYVKAFRYSPDAMLVTTLESGRLLEFNNRFLEILGYRREEVTGRTVFEIDLWADPAQRDVMTRQLRETGQVRNLEFQIHRRDGQLRWVRTSAELLEVEGEPCLFAVARDVSTREESLLALRRQEALLHQAKDAVVVIDRDDVVTFANEAAVRILGVPRDELRARKLADALDASKPEVIDTASRQTRVNGVWRGLVESRRGNFDAFCTLVTDAQGSASAKLIFLRPMSD